MLVQEGEVEAVRRCKVEEDVSLVSDHCAVWVEVEEGREKEVKGVRRKRWKLEVLQEDDCKYVERLKEEMVGWKEMVEKRMEREEGKGVVEGMWQEFKERVMRAMESGVGKKMVNGRAKAWWNDEVEKLKEGKDEVYRELRRAEKEGLDVRVLRERYRVRKKRVQEVCEAV